MDTNWNLTQLTALATAIGLGVLSGYLLSEANNLSQKRKELEQTSIETSCSQSQLLEEIRKEIQTTQKESTQQLKNEIEYLRGQIRTLNLSDNMVSVKEQKVTYSIFFLLTGNVGLHHFSLRDDISTKFKIYSAVSSQSPSHITLKYDFEASSTELRQLEAELYAWSNEQKPSEMEIGGIDHFYKKTIFLGIKLSQQAQTALNSFFKVLKERCPWMTWERIPHPIHEGQTIPLEGSDLIPHATLAFKDIDENNFGSIMAFSKECSKNSFQIEWDHVAICPMIGGYRQVERVFYFPRQTPLKYSVIQNANEPNVLNKITDLQEEKISITDVLPQGLTVFPNDPKEAKIFSSNHISRIINIALSRYVAGLEVHSIRFSEIVNVIVQNNCQALLYGGFIRDLFNTGSLSEDIDMLFTCTVDPYLISVCKARSWPYKVKIDEKNQQIRNDFIAIGDSKKKTKFSGHFYGSGCEGEFTCNMLLYVGGKQKIVDPTGTGIEDAQNRILRIPYPREKWNEWVETDRLVGMRLIRYFNFRTRDFKPANEETAKFILNSLKDLFQNQRDEMKTTVRVFFERKIFVSNKQMANLKYLGFRSLIENDYNKFYEKGGKDFFDRHFLPCLPSNWRELTE